MARETAAQRAKREAEATPEATDEPFDAVVVVRETQEDGGIGTRVVLSGDVKPTEVETILKLGLRGWQQQIGV